MTTIRLFPIVILVSACAGNTVRDNETRYVTGVDRDEVNKQFDVTIASKSAIKLCLDANSWPNDQGKVLDGTSFALLIGSKVVTPSNPPGDTCVLGCAPIEIAPGQTIRGKVNYSNFSASSPTDAKLLVLSKPHRCSPLDYPIRTIDDTSPLQREP